MIHPLRSLLIHKIRQTMGAHDALWMETAPQYPEISSQLDISYLPDGSDAHLLDVHYPAGTDTPLPTIMEIHGGAWMYGSKEVNRSHAKALASKGFTVVCINYRLLPETDLSGQIQDVFAALRFLKEQGRGNYWDSDRVFLTGDSSGAHLAFLAAALMKSAPLQKCYGVCAVGVPIRGLALSHGVCAPEHLFAQGTPIQRWMVRALLSALYGDHRKELRGHISYPDFPSSLPPTLLISGGADEMLCGQTLAMKDFLDENGGVCRLIFFEKENYPAFAHVFHIQHPDSPEGEIANSAIAGFFHEILEP